MAFGDRCLTYRVDSRPLDGEWEPAGPATAYYPQRDETPESVARVVASIMHVVDETHEGRVCVWAGASADTSTDPAHIHHIAADQGVVD